VQQSSLSDIAQHFASAARQGVNLAMATRNHNNMIASNNSAGNPSGSSNVAMARKLQFYTSNNFYPSK
jgi:hypothetical protein